MAKPIPNLNLQALSKNDDVKAATNKDYSESVIDSTINRINKKKSGRDLVIGTVSGWLCGLGSYKLGKTAAFGIGGSIILLHFAVDFGYIHVNWDRVREALNRGEELVEKLVQFVMKNSCFSVGFIGGFFFDDSVTPAPATVSPLEEDPHITKKQLPIEPIPIKPLESFKHYEKPAQPSYSQSKPISHSPKISPSSIPNPNPSVISTKQSEPVSYASVGVYPFSIPGYSAFQPVSHAAVTQSSASSVQPTISSSSVVKSQSDFTPPNPADASMTSATGLPAFSVSSISQGSTLPSLQSGLSMPLASSFSSSPPITTVAAMGSIPQMTSVLSMPPNLTMASETSKPMETSQSTLLDQPTSPMPRMPLQTLQRVPIDNSMSTKVLMPSPMRLESHVQGIPTSMQIMPTSKISNQRAVPEHPHMAPDVLMQRMTQENSMSSMVSSSQQTMSAPQTMLSDALSKQRMQLHHSVQCNLKMPSDALLPRRLSEHPTPHNSSIERATVPSEPMQRAHRNTAEHSLQPMQSSESRDVPPDNMPPDSMQRVSVDNSVHLMSPNMLPQGTAAPPMSLEFSLPTNPSEELFMQRTMASMPNMVPQPLRQHIPLEHSIPSMLNMPPDPSIQRLHLDYYMPSMPMMPPELLMRRMQLLQYMQSLQTMTSEPPMSIMPNAPVYGMSMAQAQTLTSMQASLDLSMPALSTGPVVQYSQPITYSVTSQETAPIQPLTEAKYISSMSIITPESSSIPCESLEPSKSPRLLLPPSALSSEQPAESMQHIQTLQTTATMTPDSLIQSMPFMPSISQEHGVITLDQSHGAAQHTESERSLIVQTMTSRPNTSSESSNVAITQMPLEKSYKSAMSPEAILQPSEQPNEALLSSEPLLEPNAPRVPTLMSLNKPMASNSHLQPFVSIGITSTLTTPIAQSASIVSMQTSVPSMPTTQQRHFVRPLQITPKIETDNATLQMQTTHLSEPSKLQNTIIPIPMQTITSTQYVQPSKPMNSTHTMQSISSISTASSLSPTSQIPLTQSMPQLSTTLSDPAIRSTQRDQLIKSMPLTSATPSASSQSQELMPPISLVQSMSSMTLTPSINSINSTQSVCDSFKMIQSCNSSDVTQSDLAVPNSLALLTTSPLHVDESLIESEVLHDPDTPQPLYHTNFEGHLTKELPSTAKNTEDVSKICIGSQSLQGATNEILPQTLTKDIKRKPVERFSLKTSIPISKIDMKCVPNPPDNTFQNPLSKKLTFNAPKANNRPRIETRLQRQINRGVSGDDEYQSIVPSSHANLTTLINAAEAINVKDNQFRRPEPKVKLMKDSNPIGSQQNNSSPANKKEANKSTFQNFSSDMTSNEQKNQIVFIQNKNCTNKKMILAIKQQNPQVLLKQKLQPTPRFLNQQKMNKEESVTITEHIPSKVVALKRLHQADCDEDDFENLITENQIYGNKIVVKEKIQGTSQEQNLKLKNNRTNKLIQSEQKNVIKPPNFVYLSNVKYPTNVVMYKNNTKTTKDKNSKLVLNDNKITEYNSTVNKSTGIIKKPIEIQSITIIKEKDVVKSINNLLPITSNIDEVNDDQITHSKVQNIADTNNKTSGSLHESKTTVQNLNNIKQKAVQHNTNNDKVINFSRPGESSMQPKVVITDVMRKSTQVEEEISCLDIYEKRKKMSRLKHLSIRDAKDVQKSESKKPSNNGRYIITPEKVKAEIYKEFASTRLTVENEDSDTESDYGEEELNDYESLIERFGPNKNLDCGKTEFLSNFMLGSQETCKDILWNKRERSIQKDKIALAYIAAGRLDQLMNGNTLEEITTPNPIIPTTASHGSLSDKGSGLKTKQRFMSQLNLKFVQPEHKEGYEMTWQEILKERKRRDAPNQSNHVFKQPRTQPEKVEMNTNSELEMLTKIKNSVSENNNLIKKRLDLSCQKEGDNIKTLTEKNFSELNRLSMMADRSVKHFSGQDSRKRDLNPGFDSENIQNPKRKLDSPIHFPHINIPNISKIISLKTTTEPSPATTSQATSMDEPQNSAAGVEEMFSEANVVNTKDTGCQTDNAAWLGVEEMLKIYKDFVKARKKEVVELNRRNTALQVEGAHITRNASRLSDRARALLAERKNLSSEETAVNQSIQKLFSAVDVVRNYF